MFGASAVGQVPKIPFHRELAYLRCGGLTAGNPITLEARKEKEAALAKPPLLPGVCSMSCLFDAGKTRMVSQCAGLIVGLGHFPRMPLSGISLGRGLALALQESFPNATTNFCFHGRRHRL